MDVSCVNDKTKNSLNSIFHFDISEKLKQFLFNGQILKSAWVRDKQGISNGAGDERNYILLSAGCQLSPSGCAVYCWQGDKEAFEMQILKQHQLRLKIQSDCIFMH